MPEEKLNPVKTESEGEDQEVTLEDLKAEIEDARAEVDVKEFLELSAVTVARFKNTTANMLTESFGKSKMVKKEEKLTIEGLVVELKKVERVTDGGVQTSYEAKIQARGDEGENVVKIKSNQQINLAEGEVVQIKAIQTQKSLDDFTEPKVN